MQKAAPKTNENELVHRRPSVLAESMCAIQLKAKI